MTADELIADALKNRKGKTNREALEPSMLREFLALTLDHVLDGLDYKTEPTSSQAVAARWLAAMICSADDALGKEVRQ
jgi:hypothetical protein